jgi:hypothetical protein
MNYQVQITSSWFYAEVARQTPVAGEYHCVDVAVKETTTIAWICLPDRVLAANWPFADPPGQLRATRPAPPGAGGPGAMNKILLRGQVR